MMGALIGACAGVAVGWAAGVFAGPSVQVWLVPVGGAAGFVLGIFLMRGLHRFVFFVAGASVGVGVGQVCFLWTAGRLGWVAQAPAIWQWVFMVAGAVAVGVAMTRGSRAIVTLAASVAGAFLVVTSIAKPFALLAFIPLALASFCLQMGLLRRLMPPRDEEGEAEDEEERQE